MAASRPQHEVVQHEVVQEITSNRLQRKSCNSYPTYQAMLEPVNGLGAGRTADVDGQSLVIGSVAIMLQTPKN